MYHLKHNIKAKQSSSGLSIPSTLDFFGMNVTPNITKENPKKIGNKKRKFIETQKEKEKVFHENKKNKNLNSKVVIANIINLKDYADSD